MMKYLLGTLLATVAYFFWIEPLFFAENPEHPRMALFNAGKNNETLRSWNQQVTENSKQTLKSTDVSSLDLSNLSDEEVNKALEEATREMCNKPGFAERFGITSEECVKRTLSYYEKCRETLVDDIVTLLTDTDAVVENGVGALKCQL